MQDSTRLVLTIVSFLTLPFTVFGADEVGISKSESAHWYWSYNDEPILLLGGSQDDNLFQLPDLKSHLDEMKEVGANYIRNTMSARDEGNIHPFLMTDDGRYDLTQWNAEYWTRFDNLLKWTHERDIIVQIEIWDRFDFTDSKDLNNWQTHPFNPNNNVNYTYDETGFDRDYPDHPNADKHRFFHTVPGLNPNEVILKYQKGFIDKMLSHSLNYGNVLYCMNNETSTDARWGQFWMSYLKDAAKAADKTIYVTDMWDDWNPQGEQHQIVYNHPEHYDFVDISQNNHNSGEKHWANLQWVRDRVSDSPRPLNTVKIYGADGGRFGSSRDGVERFWRNLFGGIAATRFHRPDSGIGLSELAKMQIRNARRLTKELNIFQCQPDADHTLLGDREDNEAYLTYEKGLQYAIYFPDEGDITLDLAGISNTYSVEWISLSQDDRETEHPSERIEGGKVQRLTTPGEGAWAVVMIKAN